MRFLGGAMVVTAFKHFRILILTGIGVSISPLGLAQQSEFSLTPPLANANPIVPSLTDNPQTAPITTLAIDLLAPQRPFIYDPTGSSVSANRLDPAVYPSALSSTSAETDTALRDAFQTGQLSLYAPKALSAASPISGVGTASSPSRNDSASAAEPVEELDSSQEYERQGGTDYRSSWGAGSAFGTQTAESSWGVRPTGGPRRLVSRPESSDSPSSLDISSSFNSSSARRNPVLGGSSSLGRKSPFDRDSWLGGSHSLGNEYSRSSSRYEQNQASGGGRATRPGASYPASESGLTALERSGTGAAQNSFASTTPNENPDFSLRPRRGNSFGQGNVFGETPFSSPAGSGELTFLNPNILAAGFQGLPSDQATPTRQRTLRQGLGSTGGLATSANGYRLRTHPRTTESGNSGNATAKSKRTNPYLTPDSEAMPDNLQTNGLEDRAFPER